MIIAGVDAGVTNTQIVWGTKEMRRRSTAIHSLEFIIQQMKWDKVTHFRCIGLRVPEELKEHFIQLPFPDKDPIKLETRIQAAGARSLLHEKVGRHLVVSVGTGVSYTLVVFGKAFKIPLGNSLGGGFLDGQRRVLGLDFETFDRMAVQGEPLDVFVRDLIPGHAMGDFVVANFGKAQKESSPNDVCASIVHCVATAIAKDIALYGFLTKDIVFVGQTMYLGSLRRMLYNYTMLLGKEPHFSKHMAFAGAVGAWKG